MRLDWHVPRLLNHGCGLSARVRAAARALAQRGHDVRLLVPGATCEAEATIVDGARVLRFDRPESAAPHWSLQALARGRRARRAAEAIGPAGADAVLTCQPEFAAAIRRRTSLPVILVACSSQLLYEAVERTARKSRSPTRRWAYALNARLMRRGERGGFRAASAVAFDSTLTRDLVVSRYGLRPERCHVVPPTVDLRRFSPLRDGRRHAQRIALGLRGDAFVVCWSGRMADQKNVELLIDAVALCRPHAPRVALALVGDGPHRSALEARAAAAGLDGSVHFPGLRQDVERWLQASDVFVLPSRVESFGIAVIEAMACGLPGVALASNGCVRSGAGDSILDGVTGRLLPDDSPETLARCLGDLIHRPDLRAVLGAAARKRAETYYAPGRDAAQLEAIVEGLRRDR